MIELSELYRNLEEATIKLSNYDINRSYIGLSQFYKCPKVIVTEYLTINNAEDISFLQYQKSFNGYTYERRMKDRLKHIYGHDYVEKYDINVPHENERLRILIQGHTDGLLFRKHIIEISTVSDDTYLPKKISAISKRKYIQIQAYMTFSEFREKAIYICESRSSGRFKIFFIYPKYSVIEKIKKKAIAIFNAVEKKELPKCWCERCEK